MCGWAVKLLLDVFIEAFGYFLFKRSNVGYVFQSIDRFSIRVDNESEEKAKKFNLERSIYETTPCI